MADAKTKTAARKPAQAAPTDQELYEVACNNDECKTYTDIINFVREVLSRWGSTQKGGSNG